MTTQKHNANRNTTAGYTRDIGYSVSLPYDPFGDAQLLGELRDHPAYPELAAAVDQEAVERDWAAVMQTVNSPGMVRLLDDLSKLKGKDSPAAQKSLGGSLVNPDIKPGGTLAAKGGVIVGDRWREPVFVLLMVALCVAIGMVVGAYIALQAFPQ